MIATLRVPKRNTERFRLEALVFRHTKNTLRVLSFHGDGTEAEGTHRVTRALGFWKLEETVCGADGG